MAPVVGGEGRLQQRGEGGQVGGHHHHVPGLEMGMVGEDVEQGVAQNLRLAPGAVADVDLDRPVRRCRSGVGVGADVALEAAQEGVAGRFRGLVPGGVGEAGRPQHRLQLPRVASPCSQDRMLRQFDGGVGRP